MNDFSRGTWTYLLTAKSNAFSILKSFLWIIERQFNANVKQIRSDNALELGQSAKTSSFLQSEETLHQTSCTATPQKNGIVERKHGHLLEIARALLFHSEIPISYGESPYSMQHMWSTGFRLEYSKVTLFMLSCLIRNLHIII